MIVDKKQNKESERLKNKVASAAAIELQIHFRLSIQATCQVVLISTEAGISSVISFVM
jgi:hypothetical protein